MANKIIYLLLSVLVCAPLFGGNLFGVKAASANLIANPSVEDIDSTTGDSTGWFRGNWGTNSTAFTILNNGQTGSKSLKVTITQLTSGDAKWYFEPVPVKGGSDYIYSDYYRSNVTSELVAQYIDEKGGLSYQFISSTPKKLSWSSASFAFSIPENAETMTVFHLISSVGYLITDNFSLSEKEKPIITGNVPNNSVEFALVSNPNMPAAWLKNNWGSNSTTFTYLNSGYTGSRSIKTQITSYSSGDAKWYFEPQKLLPNTTYQFSDYYKSNIESGVVLAAYKTDGSISYIGLKNAPAFSVWVKYSDIFTTPADIATLTVFHLIAGVGYLVTDDYSITTYQSIGFTNGMVSITLDDGWQSGYLNGLPLLAKYALPSTLYLVSNYLNQPGYMTSDQALEFKNAGSEIGSHSVTHPDLSALSLDQMTAEASNSKLALEQTFGPVYDFASPYGAYNMNVLNVIKQYYSSHRSVDVGYNSKENFDAYNIRTQNVLSTTTMSEFVSWLNQAAANKTWLVLVYHGIDDDGSAYSTAPANFDRQLATVKASGLEVATVHQALGKLLPQL